ncbi:HU family DNA-binding protein [Psychrobacter sp. AT9]|uniref:HU family DNA-binding protein n=1 Tax=Psychrobacter sp. AT9 TaxID=3242893 RepID=UPI0039A64902
MNKQELIKKIAQDSHRTDTSAAIALQIVLDAITDTLASGDDVKLVGFGTFKARPQPARIARNPKTGDEIEVPAKHRVSFVAGKSMKETVSV